jgi:hypothetical protein
MAADMLLMQGLYVLLLVLLCVLLLVVWQGQAPRLGLRSGDGSVQRKSMTYNARIEPVNSLGIINIKT